MVPGFIIMCMGWAAWGTYYSMESFFADGTNPSCVMNGLGSFAVTFYGVFQIIRGALSYHYMDDIRYSDDNRSIVRPAALIAFFWNIFAIASFAGTHSLEDTCTFYSTDVTYSFYYGGSTLDFDFVCTITSFQETIDFKYACMNDGQGDETFDCDYGAPGIWTAIIVFLSLDLCVNLGCVILFNILFDFLGSVHKCSLQPLYSCFNSCALEDFLPPKQESARNICDTPEIVEQHRTGGIAEDLIVLNDLKRSNAITIKEYEIARRDLLGLGQLRMAVEAKPVAGFA